jgi:hypothetical protein
VKAKLLVPTFVAGFGFAPGRRYELQVRAGRPRRGPGELAGMTMERNAVMTATSVHAPTVESGLARYQSVETHPAAVDSPAPWYGLVWHAGPAVPTSLRKAEVGLVKAKLPGGA